MTVKVVKSWVYPMKFCDADPCGDFFMAEVYGKSTGTNRGIIGKDNQGIPWEESLNAVMIVYK